MKTPCKIPKIYHITEINYKGYKRVENMSTSITCKTHKGFEIHHH